MPTALPLAAAATGGSVTEAQFKTWLTELRAALAEMGDPLGSPGGIQNLSLAFSVGSSALTCNVKTRAGAAPSATDPVSVAMRNATLATGDFNVRNISAALSLVISSGSTLGHASAVSSPIYWYLIDNAGSLELAASTSYFGQQGIVSTTAEGGAGAADSASVMYSATARSNVSFRCIGRTLDTQTTEGTWAAVPSSSEIGLFEVGPSTSIQVGESIVRRKTADESVASSVTLQDDDHLTFPIGANEEFIATYFIKVGTLLGTHGIKVAITSPAGATQDAFGSLMQTSGGTPLSNFASGSGSDIGFAAASFAVSLGFLTITTRVLNGSTPGNVTLQFAQATSNANPITFYRGGFLTAQRVA